jgi:Spherulation-specific family 4
LSYLNRRLLVPLYNTPPSGYWNDVIAAAPAVGIIIANVSSGPGSSIQANYTTAINSATAAGIVVAGYVWTNFAAASIASVEAQITQWQQFYGVTTIFLDACACTVANHLYYNTLVSFIHGNGGLAILNPGTPPDQSYFSLPIGDIISVQEDTDANWAADAAAAPSWLFSYNSSSIAVAVSSCATSGNMETDIGLGISAFNAGWMYVTADSIWNAEPSYFATEVSYIESLGATNYTTNWCPNPSFETDLTGWTTTDANTVTVQDTTIGLYGGSSLMATTDGSIPGQGVIGPSATITPATLGSMSVSIYGASGTVQVSALYNPGGIVLKTQQVALNGAWTTVYLDNLNIPNTAQVYIVVQTVGQQQIAFHVDGVMYEPETPHHPYCDGDQPGCFWSGTPEETYSYQPYQYSIAATADMIFSGSVTIINPGLVFTLVPEVLTYAFSDGLTDPSFTVVQPVACLTDFGIWELTDPDPAQTHARWNNAGMMNSDAIPSVEGYNRPYAMVVPPLDYPVSGGALAWKRAAYMGVGFQWLNVANGQIEVLTDVMANVQPIAAPPLNQNYDFETTIVPWTGFNNGTVTRSTGWAFGNSTASLLLQGNGATANPQTLSEQFLVLPGQQYAIQGWAYSTQGYATGVQLGVNWFTDADVYIGATTCALTALPATTATYLYVTGTAPSNAYTGQVIYEASGTPANTVTFYLDKAKILSGYGDFVPPAYSGPRQIQAIIKPTRLNYVMNPSFETSTYQWSEVGTGVTLSTDATKFASPGGSWEVSFTGNGSTANPGIWTVNTFTVSPYVTYSAAAWLGISGAYASGVTVNINWYNSIGTKIGSTATSPAVTGVTPTIVTATGQAPVGAATAAVVITAAGTPANTVVFYASAAEISASNWLVIPPAITWTGLNAATPVIISSFTPVDLSTVGGVQSMKVALSANTGSGAQITIPYLFPGETYIASAYVQPGAQLADILISAGSANGDVNGSVQNAIGYGSGTYGGGPYGGVAGSNVALTVGLWTQISVIFTASADTQVIEVTAVPVTGATYPVDFWVDAVLLEIGDILNPYFDGNSGSPDYMWEVNGPANLTRSYYYGQYEYGQHVVANTLAAQTPFGISAATPLYATLPTQ